VEWNKMGKYRKPMDFATEFDDMFKEVGRKIDEESEKEYRKNQERELRERKKRIEEQYPRFLD
jgi:hypothetical protein